MKAAYLWNFFHAIFSRFEGKLGKVDAKLRKAGFIRLAAS
jgi:hypothetical protein